jgi:polysaccharide pyruvyl transferase WcaK-like protein
MNKKIILFAGAYGTQNAGDDLPLLVMCKNLKNFFNEKKLDFRVISRHPDPWEEQQYSVTMIKNLEFESREESTGKWFQGLNYGDDKKNLERIRDEIKNCDLLVLGAGNFLIDKTIDLFRGPIPFMIFLPILLKIQILLQ